jgi:hypothetical protein
VFSLFRTEQDTRGAWAREYSEQWNLQGWTWRRNESRQSFVRPFQVGEKKTIKYSRANSLDHYGRKYPRVSGYHSNSWLCQIPEDVTSVSHERRVYNEQQSRMWWSDPLREIVHTVNSLYLL